MAAPTSTQSTHNTVATMEEEGEAEKKAASLLVHSMGDADCVETTSSWETAPSSVEEKKKEDIDFRTEPLGRQGALKSIRLRRNISRICNEITTSVRRKKDSEGWRQGKGVVST